ncbi:probable peptidyl-tRNA hydrolase [Mya arenaria]|uniref:probable peptidyl-tRNA hydrolase n=1 Tax=Mya arenaria TaxID=6604 RepID=UPI0022E5C372|nr:probable peptidyl-tRNA hydrolase [Mya arenaria]
MTMSSCGLLFNFINRTGLYKSSCLTFSRSLFICENGNARIQRRNLCLSMCSKQQNESMESHQKETFLIAGLGNPDMPKTRHNVGMMLISRLVRLTGTAMARNKGCQGLVGVADLSNVRLVLLTPKIAMNLNGRSVAKTAKAHNVPAAHIYIAHDDLDLHQGKVKIKERGSANGHNGLRSVISSLQTDDFHRLRIGIDRPRLESMVGDYVLETFSKSEMGLISPALDAGIQALGHHIGKKIGVPAANVFR